VISTPELVGTILPGITRKSIIQLARSRGYEVLALSRIEVDSFVSRCVFDTEACMLDYLVRTLHLVVSGCSLLL